jgi:hypothetical protein
MCFKKDFFTSRLFILATFNDLKTKLRNHNGLSKEHGKTFINAYLAKSYER